MPRIASLLLVFILLLSTARSALAVCPVCTVAVAGGLGISRFLGIDDTISGVWIGGLVMSAGLWIASWLVEKKNWFQTIAKLFAIALTFSFTWAILMFAGLLGLPSNTIFGMDKLLVGMTLGAATFYTSVLIDQISRWINNGKVVMYYQKVTIPMLLLSIVSLVLYLTI